MRSGNESIEVKERTTEIWTEKKKGTQTTNPSVNENKCKEKSRNDSKGKDSGDETQTFFSCLLLYILYECSVDYVCWIPSLCNNIRIAKNKRRKNIDTGLLVVFIQFVGCLNEKLSVPCK